MRFHRLLRPNARGFRSTLFGLVAVALFVGCSVKVTEGTLFERHVETGRPEVDIYMHGFVDSSFDAYLVQDGRPELLFPMLPCMKSDFGNSTNKLVHGKPAKRSAGRRDYMPMYAVVWSTNSPRFGITWQGYFVAACDTVSKQRIANSNPARRGEYLVMDGLIARFLAGSTVTTNEVATVQKEEPRSALKETGK